MTVTNTVPPVVSGTPKQGQFLTTTDGTWTFDLDELEYDYRWLRCDAAGDNCVAISGETQNRYQLRSADVGSTIRSEVTATEIATPPPPDTGPYDYRFATFSTVNDKIKGCTNRFQPVQSWWVPGQANGTPWPDGGGIHEISTAHGPGFKMCIVPQMQYPAANPDSIECNFNSYPADVGGEVAGRTFRWEWTEYWPSGSENPAGWPAGTWTIGEGVNYATSNPSGTLSVGHHLFMDWSNSYGLGWRFGRQNMVGAGQSWNFTQHGPFTANTYYHQKWEIKHSASSDGYIKVWTTEEGDAEGSPWVNYTGVTHPTGWRVWKFMFTFRNSNMNRHQTKHLINARLTVL